MREPIAPRRTTNMLIIIAALIVILAGLKAGQSLLVPFLLAVFIATIASTPIQWLTRHRVPNWLAVLLVAILVVLVLTGLGLVVLQTFREYQAEQDVYIEKVRELINNVANFGERLGMPISDDTVTTLFNPDEVVDFAGYAIRRIGQVLSNFFLILLTVIFILAEATEWPKKLRTFLSDREMEIEWLNQFGSTLNRYIAIKSTTSLLTGVLVTILLTIMQVDFAILWGLLAFLLNYIPNIGSFIAATPGVLVAMVQLGYGPAFIVLIGYVVINVGVGAGIEPRFLGRTLGLSTLVVFLSLIFWGWMFGPVGMLLSVPLTMTAKIAFGTSESTEWIAHLLEPGVPRNSVQQSEQ